MNMMTELQDVRHGAVLQAKMRIAGELVGGERTIDVRNPYNGSLVGTVTVVGGLAGTACGGLLADYLKRHTRQPYLALSGLSMLPATLLKPYAQPKKQSRAWTDPVTNR